LTFQSTCKRGVEWWKKVSAFLSNLKIDKIENLLVGGTHFLTDAVDRGLRRIGITVSKPVLAAIAIIFGVILIIFPALVGIIIGIFLIIQGILLLTDYMETSRQQSNAARRTYTPPPIPTETPPAPPPTENA
jgi:hypothetical protein